MDRFARSPILSLVHKLGRYCQVSGLHEAEDIECGARSWSSINKVQTVSCLSNSHRDNRDDLVVTGDLLDQSLARSYAASVLFGEKHFFEFC